MKIRNYLINLFVSLIYPIFKYVSTPSGKIIAFSDACFIISMITMIIGLVTWMFLKGDFDLTAFIMQRKSKYGYSDYNQYKEHKREERKKDSFNYPLLVSLSLLLISVLTSLIA